MKLSKSRHPRMGYSDLYRRYFLTLLLYAATLATSNTFAQDHSQHTDHTQHADHSQHTATHTEHLSKPTGTEHARHPGHDSHDPLIFYFNMEELQSSLTQDDAIYKSKLHSWIGKDKNKLVFNARIENSENVSEYIEKEILLSSAFSAFWNWQIGLRQDRNPLVKTEWISFGLEGEAPYFIHSQLHLIADENGNTGLRLHFQQDWRINDSWKLKPETELNFYTDDNIELFRQSGLNDLHVSLKLLYDKNRKLAPYLAFEYEKKWAEQYEAHLADSSQISAGLSFWF